MKKLLFSLVILISFSSLAFGQVPEPIATDGFIVGGAGVTKFVGNPNAIASMRVINEKQYASIAWDTFKNVLWRYNRLLPIGKRWVRFQEVQYSNGATITKDTAYKFVVDTVNRKLFVCNSAGCLDIGATATPAVNNGRSIGSGNEIQLGGILNKSTTIFTDATNTLKIRGLQSAIAGDSLLTVDPFTGQLRRRDGSGLMTNSAALGMFKTKIEYDFDTAITNAEMRNNINYVDTKIRDSITFNSALINARNILTDTTKAKSILFVGDSRTENQYITYSLG